MGDNDNLVPQFACNPTWDDLDEFAAQIKQTGVRSIRMFPAVHNYPFRDWVVGPWLEWAEAEGIPVWIPHSYDLRGQSMVIDPEAVHDTLESHPGVNAVLSEVGYQDEAWAVPLLRSLPNLHVEISRMINTDEISRVTGLLGEERVLFGSRVPGRPDPAPALLAAPLRLRRIYIDGNLRRQPREAPKPRRLTVENAEIAEIFCE